MRIIDAHAHVGPAFATRPPMFPGVTASDILPLMDRAGVAMTCIFPPAWEGPEFQDPTFEIANAALAREVTAHRDRFFPFARVNPNFRAQAASELHRCRDEYGCVGLKLHPLTEYFWVSNLGLLRPLFRYCAEWRWPVFFHSGYYPTCQPALFAPLAEEFPAVPIILAHLSYAHTADAIIVARRCPNVYLETSANSSSASIRQVYESVGPRQLVYGSDLPFTDPRDVLDKIRCVPGIPVPDLEFILGGNVAAMLHLDGEAGSKEARS